ncbi:Uncharacterized protein Rs2_31312 [Raphanus sativus]|nr:Uncharacterized protein Rs2_31312 [Raphanus sativus]
MDFPSLPSSTPDPPDDDAVPLCDPSSPSTATPPSSVPAEIPNASAPSYAQRFKDSLRNLKKISTPISLSDGLPVVEAPDSIILKASEEWKDHILAKFHGRVPHPDRIFADLNPVWGKNGDITVTIISPTACLIFVPSVPTREWILQVGYWQVSNCALSAYPWTPGCSLEEEELVSAPTWVILQNVPLQLYSLEGISVIASGIGEPLHTEHSKLPPFHYGDTKVKVEIGLDAPPPAAVIVRDSQGFSVRIDAKYPRLPPQCCNCGKFGHMLNCCPLPVSNKGRHRKVGSNTQRAAVKEVRVRDPLLSANPAPAVPPLLPPASAPRMIARTPMPQGIPPKTPRSAHPPLSPVSEVDTVIPSPQHPTPPQENSPHELSVSSQSNTATTHQPRQKSIGHRTEASRRLVLTTSSLPLGQAHILVPNDEVDGFQPSPATARKARKLQRKLVSAKLSSPTFAVNSIFSKFRSLPSRGSPLIQ